MNQQTLDKLQALADKMGVAVHYLWAALIKEAYIEGVMNIIFAAISLTISYKIYKYFIVIVKDWDSYAYDDGQKVKCVFAFIFAVACFTAFFPFIWEGVQDVLNPAYFALTSLKGLI